MAAATQEPGGRGLLFVVGQLGLLALIAFGPRRLGGAWPAPWGPLAVALGLALGLVGGLLAVAGARHLGSNLTPFPRPKTNATLIRSGAYRVVRHPIYSGLIMLSFGWALFVHGNLTLLYALALFVLLDAKTRREERWLVARFDDYREYRRRVRRLIPFLY